MTQTTTTAQTVTLTPDLSAVAREYARLIQQDQDANLPWEDRPTDIPDGVEAARALFDFGEAHQLEVRSLNELVAGLPEGGRVLYADGEVYASAPSRGCVDVPRGSTSVRVSGADLDEVA